MCVQQTVAAYSVPSPIDFSRKHRQKPENLAKRLGNLLLRARQLLLVVAKEVNLVKFLLHITKLTSPALTPVHVTCSDER